MTCFDPSIGKPSPDVVEQISIKQMIGLLLRPIRLMADFFGVKM